MPALALAGAPEATSSSAPCTAASRPRTRAISWSGHGDALVSWLQAGRSTTAPRSVRLGRSAPCAGRDGVDSSVRLRCHSQSGARTLGCGATRPGHQSARPATTAGRPGRVSACASLFLLSSCCGRDRRRGASTPIASRPSTPWAPWPVTRMRPAPSCAWRQPPDGEYEHAGNHRHAHQRFRERLARAQDREVAGSASQLQDGVATRMGAPSRQQAGRAPSPATRTAGVHRCRWPIGIVRAYRPGFDSDRQRCARPAGSVRTSPRPA